MTLKTKIRHYLIREGIIKPRSLAETREVFSFPVSTATTKPRAPLQHWATRHIEPLHLLPHNRYK